LTGEIEIIRPKDRAAWLRLRKQDVTASQIGALFGEHEYTTAFELWAVKTGRVARDEEESPAMQRGRLLESVAVALLREQYPLWEIEHNAAANIYYRDPAARLGGTPDVIVSNDHWQDDEDRGRRGRGVVQIKSVEASIFRRKWIDEEGNVEVPLWIALQATLEAYLTGAEWAAVAPLVIGHGLDMPLIDIPLVSGVVDAMKAKVAEFWQMVAEGREPVADYARDGALLDRLYAEGDEFHEVDLSADNRVAHLISERAVLADDARAASLEIQQIDAEIKSKLGQAHIAHIAGGKKITWKPVKRTGFYVEPTTYRQLRYPKEN